VNLGVEELDLVAATQSRLGVPVGVENDVKAAALGAFALHGGSGSMGYLNLGTGIAAGIVSEGVLWRGARGTAGEVGHISVDPNGPLCRCGQRGCIEALAGGGAIAERWGHAAALPVRDVFDAADAGDARARELRAGLARGVAAAVRVLVLTADVDAVVLGGGVTALGPRLMADVAAELAASAEASPFMRSLRLRERVELLPAGSPAAALGAALVGAALDPEGALARG
jgi:predicted NBD/HSP70 family sugar kinase